MAESIKFNYVAQNTLGEQIKGTVRANTEAKAYTAVKAKGLMPLSVKRADAGMNMEISIPGIKKGPKLKNMSVWAKQFGTLIKAGMPLIKALYVSTENTEDKALKTALQGVYSDVDKGSSLAVALSKHPDTFPPLIVNLIRVGEAGGFLEKTLTAVAENLNSEVEIRGRIKSALVYPVVVGVIAILAVVVMLIFVVPVFVDMFEGMGSTLPLPTQILITLSENMIWAGPLALAVIFGIGAVYKKNKNKEGVRKVIDKIKLKMPVFGGLNKKVAIARFSRNLAMMVSAGVPLMNALELVGSTADNWVVERAIDHARDMMKKGSTLSTPLEDHEDVFPSMVTSMIAVGEDSGALDQMLDSIADFYEDEVKLTTDSLSSAMEPVMILFLGGIIGGMVVSLYMPMFSIFGEIAEAG